MNKKYWPPEYTFERYLIHIGSRIEDTVTYDVKEVWKHIKYFRRCYNREQSAYMALIFLPSHIESEGIKLNPTNGNT